MNCLRNVPSLALMGTKWPWSLDRGTRGRLSGNNHGPVGTHAMAFRVQDMHPSMDGREHGLA